MRVLTILLVFVLSVVSAQAATFGNFGVTVNGGINVTTDGDTQDTHAFSFDWTDIQNPSVGRKVFSADGAFDLFLTDYVDLGDQAQVSAFTLSVTDGINASTQIVGPTDNCSILGTGCFPVTNTTATMGAGGLVELASQPSTDVPILSGLGAGVYLFTFGESGLPSSGFANFEVRTAVDVSAVPLPASSLLLLAGLGGLMGLRKRR